ncbi:MAG: hypothetical protein LH619_01215 [Chitinophagaceae bacterium]|nr:hypothetical protein [Chitinophagaceae bacterium]
MYKIYFPFISILLISCSTKIRYIGKSLPPTKNVEVFIAEKSIKSHFDLIGKGYLSKFGLSSPDKIQKKAEKLAREKGADAVLITDYYITNTEEVNISSIYRTDTTNHGIITTGNTTVKPSIATGYNILFLKYNK